MTQKGAKTALGSSGLGYLQSAPKLTPSKNLLEHPVIF